VSWDFWRRVDELDKRTSDPERIARNARAGFAANNESFLGSDLFRKASSTGCRGSNDCGSGFACIDGRCTKIFTRNGGNWTPNSCGDDNVTWVCTKGEKSGSNDKCSRPTPGNCDPDPTCPGARCCRQQRDGSIRCVCGSCEQTDTSRCNVYCDQQYKAFGTVSAGCYTRDMDGFGECGGNICDECQFCENDFFGSGGTCETGEQGDAFNPLPCHCFDKCSEECHICNKDPDSANFGECEYSPQDCMQCCTQYNYDCPQCARYFPGAQHHCEPVTSGKPCIQALREKLYKQCEADCATKPDPCAPTDSFSVCVDGSAPVDPLTNPGGPSGISCPQGKTCQYAGYLEINGKTCYFYNTWVTDDIPPECEECDCNCNNDCGDCEICNAQGECERDPVCDATTVDIWLDTSITRDQYGGCFSTTTCLKNEIIEDSRKIWSNISLEDASRWTIVTQPPGDVREGVKVCTGTCVPKGDGTAYCSGGNADCNAPSQSAYIFDHNNEYVTAFTISSCYLTGYCNLRLWKNTWDRNGTGSLRFEIRS
jgi:hypothetical protein